MGARAALYSEDFGNMLYSCTADEVTELLFGSGLVHEPTQNERTYVLGLHGSGRKQNSLRVITALFVTKAPRERVPDKRLILESLETDHATTQHP